MGSLFNTSISDIKGEYLTVYAVAELSGYNQQYIRRLLRQGVIKTRKVGQIWLIEKQDFCFYLDQAIESKDARFGPQN